jgi:phosphoribosyl-ATP pyrophosphohydrolase
LASEAVRDRLWRALTLERLSGKISGSGMRSRIAPFVSGAALLMPEPSIIAALMDVIAERKARPPAERSYVASLLEGGVPRIGAKIVEEASEVVEAAGEPGDAGREHLVKEAADLVFHTLVMLGYREIPWSAIESELARRFGISGIVEKESRSRPDP